MPIVPVFDLGFLLCVFYFLHNIPSLDTIISILASTSLGNGLSWQSARSLFDSNPN